MSASAIGHSTPEAIDFLKRFAPDGPWLLSAKQPDAGGLLTRAFTRAQVHEAAAWIEKYVRTHNLYFSVNRPRGLPRKKAEKNDIAAMLALHADVDPRKGFDLKQEQERILAALLAFKPEPSIIEFSGGGYQAFWLLEKPEPVTSDNVARLEARNRWLEKELGADNCHNIDRVLRLPGTVNLPNPKKREKGRVSAVTAIVKGNYDLRYALHNFPEAAAEEGAPGDDAPPEDRPRGEITEEIASLIADDPGEGQRSEHCFKITSALVGVGWSDDEVADRLLSCPAGGHYKNKRGNVLKDVRRMRAKIGATPRADTIIAEMNKTYAVTILGNQTQIMKLGRTPEGHTAFTFLSKDAFILWNRNKFVSIDGQRKSVGEYWLSHSKRQEYQGLVFAPCRNVADYYNLWRGFAVEPRPGDWSKFRAHLCDNVCKGDEELLRWVIGWFAAIVQRPNDKVGTSLVIRGKEGTGKSKIGEVFGSLFGPHYAAVSDPRYITGQFNAHMLSCLLLHAEEAFWAGDHSAEGKLKDLITGKTHFIEQKHKDPVPVRNLVRLFVTGNPDWIVPASMEARRFAVFEIGEKQRGNGRYFAAIDEEADRGGREALLYDLMHFDLSGIDLRTVPKTEALLQQKIRSLSIEQRWWLDTLQNGRLPYGTGEAGSCPTAMLFDAYVKHSQKVGASRRSIETTLGYFLKENVPNLARRRATYRNYNGNMETGQKYVFPTLEECRAAFEEKLGQPIPWTGPAEWLDEPEPPEGPRGEPM